MNLFEKQRFCFISILLDGTLTVRCIELEKKNILHSPWMHNRTKNEKKISVCNGHFYIKFTDLNDCSIVLFNWPINFKQMKWTFYYTINHVLWEFHFHFFSSALQNCNLIHQKDIIINLIFLCAFWNEMKWNNNKYDLHKVTWDDI